MAVVRVKRRTHEEPLDILLLACKKRKTEESVPETSVFKFAATVKDQEDTALHFTHPFKNDAENTLKKNNRRVEEIKKKIRDEHDTLAKNSRYKVVNCYRSINEDELKSENDEAGFIDSKGLTVLDVESHESKENAESPKVAEKPGPKYVYDLYYITDTADLNDLQLEHVHSVHPVNTDLMFDSYRDPLGNDSDENFDDEDDSNDENNWRNDYPDEDEYYSGYDEKENDDENDVRLSMSGFRIGDEDDDLSSEDDDVAYSKRLSPTDINNFGKSYAKYKAKVNRNEYDSSCSVDSDKS